ncbi:tyrosine-type recombinase/integrase [Faecalicatena faecalis]|nr:tyrosine-type recombinase/integrase [Faecalicatena faecalis]
MAMKRANGDGSVYKIGGKRRKPFGARVTIGWQLDPETGRSKQIYQSIGTFATRVEAETALNNYLQNPYDIEAHKITFAGVYDRWSAEYFETLKNPSSARSYKAAYAYCEPLYNIRMRDIRVEHMQGVIKDAEVGDATKGRMKSLFNLMYKWCMIHEVVEKDYSALFVHKAGKRDKTKRVPFKNSEIQKLWKMQEFSVVDMILFALYSGFRPSEVTLIETRFVDLVRWRIKGGMKTEAGTDRIVPIHEKIRPIVQKHYNPDSKFLFTNEKGEYMTYDQYRGRFKNVMRALGTTHTPHEARHTFISCAKHFDVDENLLKAIVGHKIRDVTEAVYTHRPFSDYVAAVALIDYSGEDIEFESIDADWD